MFLGNPEVTTTQTFSPPLGTLLRSVDTRVPSTRDDLIPIRGDFRGGTTNLTLPHLYSGRLSPRPYTLFVDERNRVETLTRETERERRKGHRKKRMVS